MTMKLIALDLIDDPTWNSRLGLNEKETKELAASMKARIDQGRMPLINAITVADEKDGRYELVAGSRRFAAAKLLGLAEIQCSVEGYTDDASKVIDNVVENLLRKDLTTFEEARACATLRKVGMKLREVKERTGISEPHISKLVTAYEGLAEPIRVKWQAKSPIATTDFLSELVPLEPEEQVKAFDAKEKLYAAYANDDEDEGSDKPKKKPAKVKRNFTVKREVYDLVLTALKKVKADVVTKSMLTQSVQYLVGETTKIEGVEIFPEEVVTTKPKKSTKKKGQ
jgi:ParB family chromosome partitioning protein